jgi:hypothetical protein
MKLAIKHCRDGRGWDARERALFTCTYFEEIMCACTIVKTI